MSLALEQWRARRVFPTSLNTLNLQKLGRDLHLRAITSARTTNAEYLQEIADVVDDMLAGKINMAQGRIRLLFKLKELGYHPEIGFPEDIGKVPPAELGSLRDLSSYRRLNLVLETNVRVAANYARATAGNTEEARWHFPAWELVRLYYRHTERGTVESHSAGWQRRWFDAGESVGWEGALKSRLLALKDSPIWEALAAGAGGYTDTLDNGFPPFAFNSGMGWRAVGRQEVMDHGLIEADAVPAATEQELLPGEKEINDRFAALAPDLRDALRQSMRDVLAEKGLAA